jgi:nucleoside-diphosphate-sugar epimerase
MKILVTGGTGFLGKRLVNRLVKQGNDVTVTARKLDEELPEDVTFVKADVTNKAELKKAFKNIDIVYHLAICLDENSRDLWDINVNGAKNVVDLCKEHNVKQLVYMSSSGVLGETHEASEESFPYNPGTRYEKSKTEAEKIIKQSGVNHTIIRTTIIIGPNPVWAAIFYAARRHYPIIGSGKNFFHLVYVDDVVDLLMIVKNNKKAYNEIFHVASKDTPTYEEVYKIVCDEFNIEMTEKHVPIWLAKLGADMHVLKCRLSGKQPKVTKMKSSIERLIRNRIISTDKAKQVLGFESKYTTQEAIRETIKYLKISRLGYSDYDITDINRISKK